MITWRLFWRANRLLARGDFASAKPVLIDLIARDQRNLFALLMLAQCYEREAEFSQALRFADQAVQADPASLLALQTATRLAIREGDHERAAGYLRQALVLPEVRTEMPRDIRTGKNAARLLRFLSHVPFLRRRLRTARVAEEVRQLDAGHRAVELQEWKRWALEYLAWHSGEAASKTNHVSH